MEDSLTDVSQLVGMFEESETATRDSRKKAERDIDYYDNKQWTPTEVEKLNNRKQPVVTFNRIQRKIDYWSGLEKQTRKDPKCFPRTPGDDGSADAATDTIRYVCDDNQWDEVRSGAWMDIMRPGSGAIMVGAKQVKGGIDPQLIHIPWDRFFHDPYSSKIDFTDASYMGIVTWMDEGRATARWPDAKEIISETINNARNSDTYDDKPKDKLWADYARKRVRVIEIYYLKGGQWMRCVFTQLGHLEPPQASPYLDEEGQPENPIKAISANIDRDNNRYGAIRVMISPQDEINKRRSKALHLLTMRQVRAGRSVSEDPEKIRKELARPDGVIVADDGEFEILPTNDMAAANLQLLQESKAEIDLLGANAALAGKNENDMSGRAILAQQQGGMVEVAHLFDRLRVLSLQVYRSIWARIRQYWQAERWIRITDDERNLKFVGLNQPITVQQLAQEVMQGDEAALKTAAQFMQSKGADPSAIQAAMQGDERAQQYLGLFVQQFGQEQVEVRNQISELDVDIVIDEGMDTPTVQAEQFDTIVKMLPAAPPNIAAMLWEAMFESSMLRGKDKILQKLSEGPSPEQQQEMEQQKQLVIADATSKIEKTQSETMKNVAQAQSADPSAQIAMKQQETDANLQMSQEKMQHGMMMDEAKLAHTMRMQAAKPQQQAA